MKINKTTMAIIAAAAALVACPVIHAQDASTNSTTQTSPRPRRGMSADAQVERIDKAVTLTEDEKPKVKAAVEDMIKAVQDARNADQAERRSKMSAAREDFNNKMKSILTPDQYTKFQAMPRPGRRGGSGANTSGNGSAPSGGASSTGTGQ